jgi:hypothetical protein
MDLVIGRASFSFFVSDIGHLQSATYPFKPHLWLAYRWKPRKILNTDALAKKYSDSEIKRSQDSYERVAAWSPWQTKWLVELI